MSTSHEKVYKSRVRPGSLSLYAMSTRMRNNTALLHLLSACHPKQRKAVLQTLTEQQLRSLCEVVLNVLKGTVELSHKEKQKLRKNKRVLYQLASKSVPSKKKKQILVQQGGNILPSILIPALQVLGSLLI